MNHYHLLQVSPEGRKEEYFEADQEQAYHFAYQTNAMNKVIVLWLKLQLDDGEWIDDDNWRPPKST